MLCCFRPTAERFQDDTINVKREKSRKCRSACSADGKSANASVAPSVIQWTSSVSFHALMNTPVCSAHLPAAALHPKFCSSRNYFSFLGSGSSAPRLLADVLPSFLKGFQGRFLQDAPSPCSLSSFPPPLPICPSAGGPCQTSRLLLQVSSC